MFSPCLFDPYFIISPASYTESITVIIWTIYILQIIFSKQSTLNISVFCCCPIRRKEKITVVWCNVRYGCPTIADVPLPHLHQSNFSKLVIRICFHNAKFVFLVELQFSLLFWPLRHLFLPSPSFSLIPAPSLLPLIPCQLCGLPRLTLHHQNELDPTLTTDLTEWENLNTWLKDLRTFKL